MTFCKCDEVRSWRASRKVLQIMLTLECLVAELGIDDCSSIVLGLGLLLRVSLYIVLDTSSSLRQSVVVRAINDRVT